MGSKKEYLAGRVDRLVRNCRFELDRRRAPPGVLWPRDVGPVRFSTSSARHSIDIPTCLDTKDKRLTMTQTIIQQILTDTFRERLLLWGFSPTMSMMSMHVVRYEGHTPGSGLASEMRTPMLLHFVVESVPKRGFEWPATFAVQPNWMLKLYDAAKAPPSIDPNTTYYLALLRGTPLNAPKRPPIFIGHTTQQKPKLRRMKGVQQPKFVQAMDSWLTHEYHNHYPTETEQKAQPLQWTAQTRRPRTQMIGFVENNGRAPPDGWYLPVYRYRNLYEHGTADTSDEGDEGDTDSESESESESEDDKSAGSGDSKSDAKLDAKGDGQEQKKTYCGTFYYVEPESRTLLHLGNMMIVGSKFHALSLLAAEMMAKRPAEIDPNFAEIHGMRAKHPADGDPQIAQVNMVDLQRYLWRLGYEVLDHKPKITSFWMSQGVGWGEVDTLLKKYYGVLAMDAAEMLRSKVVIRPCKTEDESGSGKSDESDDEDSKATKATGQDLEDYKAGKKVPFVPGDHDHFDQIICNYARKLGIDTIVMQHEVGDRRAVSEILDTRADSLRHLYRPRAPAAFSLIDLPHERPTRTVFGEKKSFEQKRVGNAEAWWTVQLPSCATLWFPTDGLLRPVPIGRDIKWRRHPIGNGWNIESKHLNLVTPRSPHKPKRAKLRRLLRVSSLTSPPKSTKPKPKPKARR